MRIRDVEFEALEASNRSNDQFAEAARMLFCDASKAVPDYGVWYEAHLLRDEIERLAEMEPE